MSKMFGEVFYWQLMTKFLLEKGFLRAVHDMEAF